MRSITPASAIAGTSQSVLINGMNLNLGGLTATVSGDSVSVTTNSVSPTDASLTISPASQATLGARLITLANSLGQSSPFCCFLVKSLTPGPSLDSISPSSATVGAGTTSITLSGSGFDGNSVVRANGVDLATAFVNAGQLTAMIPSSMLSTSSLVGVSVINSQSSTSDFRVFNVVATTVPTFVGVAPWGMPPGTQASAFVLGKNLLGASSVSVSGTGVTVSIGPGGTRTELPVFIEVASSAPLGPRVVHVTTPGGTSSSGNTFVIAVGGTWQLTQPLQLARANHTATRLQNGNVLLAGGSTNTAEVYDPTVETWTLTNPMNSSRSGGHTATLLANGKVLIAGGTNAAPGIVDCEIYDSSSGIWTTTGNLNQPRYAQTATLLQDGRVLVAGGFAQPSPAPGALSSAELYDPSTGLWSTTGNLNVGRAIHSATLLQNGKVLVAGGNSGDSTYLTDSELYDPATGTWSVVGSLNVARNYHAAVLLPSAKVLVAGGYSSLPSPIASAEIYDPALGTWQSIAPMNVARSYPTATVLLNGKVLLTGGGNPVPNAELFDPLSQSWSLIQPSYGNHALHTATLLLNGGVLVAGGSFNGPGTRMAEIFYSSRKNAGQITSQ